MEPKMISQLDFEAQRRRKLAEALSKGNDKPIASPLEGLAKVLREGVAGYQSGKASKFENESKQRQADIISGVVSGKTPRDEGMAQLAQIPAYQDVALKAAIEKPKFEGLKESAEQALMAQALGQPLSTEQQAAIQAFDRLRGTEMMYDPRQNVVRKYGSLLEAPAPSAAPIPARGTPQPGAGEMLPEPTYGVPGQVLNAPPAVPGEVPSGPNPVTNTAPPEGLDARARGQYMDTLATQAAQLAAERANNNGLPRMTETQQQAASRSNLISGGLQQLSDVMLNPTVDPTRMALADTVEGIGPLGSVLGNNIRTPDEQRFIAGRDAAIEGFASAVTGAGVTQDQFGRFSRLLPQGSEDPQVRREKLRNAYEFLLTQTQIAGPIANNIRAEVMQLREQGVGQPQAGGLTPAEQEELRRLEAMFGGQ